MNFVEGERVLAKAPGSSEYERAKVLQVKANDKYKIQFSKGKVEATLSGSNIRAERTSRSATRSRGRPANSPSRASPSRRRSPSRKSPGRSPSNAEKKPTRKLAVRSSTKQAKISLSRLDVGKDTSSDTDKTDVSEAAKEDFTEPAFQSRLRDVGPATRRSIRILSNALKQEQESRLMELRNADRSASLPTERKSGLFESEKERGLSIQKEDEIIMTQYETISPVSKSPEKNIMTQYETISPISKSPEKNIKKGVDFVSTPQEWGGWPGALILMVLLPIALFLPQIACTNGKCSTKNFSINQDWRTYLSLDALLLFSGFLCFVAIITMLPLGAVVQGPQTKNGVLRIRLNGLLTTFLALSVYGGCIYEGYDVTEFLINNAMQMTVVAYGIGFLISCLLYIKGGRASVGNLNIYGSTNNFIYDFWQGREINPCFGPLNMKIFLFRVGTIGTILVNAALIVSMVREAEVIHREEGLITRTIDFENLNIAGILAASMCLIYNLDGMLFEYWLTTTFIMAEGAGYIFGVGYLMYPYIGTLPARYVFYNRVHLPYYVMALGVAIFTVGLVIFRSSNNLKYQFRKNPFSPSLSHLETIPTSHGKRLIVSGLWGYVRHPNYLGDIILTWSMACITYGFDIIPYVYAIFVTFFLMYRAILDNERCKKRYGYAWDQYCSKVKYMIFKRVF